MAGMEEKTGELYDALEKKTEELNSKNDLLEVNVAVMRNMTNTHQSRLKQMSEKVMEAEKKVETMAAFEKCLISTMLNPDLEEAVKVVKLQQEKILELERKLQEKREAEESEQQSNPGESLLKLKGINISLVKQMPNTQEGLLEEQSSQNSRPVSLGEDSDKENEDSAEEEEGEKKPEELVKLTFGKADLVKPTPVNPKKCGDDGKKDAGEQGHHEKPRHPTAEGKFWQCMQQLLSGLHLSRIFCNGWSNLKRGVIKKKLGKSGQADRLGRPPPLPRSGQENVKKSRQVVIFGVILPFYKGQNGSKFSQNRSGQAGGG